MVRNARPADYEATPRPVFAIGNDFGAGHIVPAHSHRRCQLLYGASGVVLVSTDQGAWVVPPERAVWIPAGVSHEVRGIGPITTRSLFIEPDEAVDMPAHCQVLQISALMRSLLLEAVDVSLEYQPNTREGLIMALLMQELRMLPVLPLALPFPQHPGLARRCQEFVTAPDASATIDDWGQALGMSRRAFTRLFRRETGLSFVQWRQQACLLSALPRLIAGGSITSVALDLGYESAAAFTTMFKRAFGVPPKRYLRDQRLEELAGATLQKRADPAYMSTII